MLDARGLYWVYLVRDGRCCIVVLRVFGWGGKVLIVGYRWEDRENDRDSDIEVVLNEFRTDSVKGQKTGIMSQIIVIKERAINSAPSSSIPPRMLYT